MLSILGHKFDAGSNGVNNLGESELLLVERSPGEVVKCESEKLSLHDAKSAPHGNLDVLSEGSHGGHSSVSHVELLGVILLELVEHDYCNQVIHEGDVHELEQIGKVLRGSLGVLGCEVVTVSRYHRLQDQAKSVN